VSAITDLLGNYQHLIDELSIVMGSKGVFDFSVNGRLLYSKDQTGRHAEDGELLGLFRDLVGPDVALYGT